jgi:hypothetical protein
LTLQWAVDRPCRSNASSLYSWANLWYMLQWLVDILRVVWICSFLGEGCTVSRNVGLLIVDVWGCQASFGNGAGAELCTVCLVSSWMPSDWQVSEPLWPAWTPALWI